MKYFKGGKVLSNNTLFNIKPSEIAPNPHNPRLIFDQDGMDELKKSIFKVGVLVPLTVYRNTKKVPEEEYILLDGERRWRCAKELELETVPVNVIDEPKDVTQNILYMFNIHHYKREWALFPTALKLENLMEALETDSEKILSDFTGVSRSTIRRCKALLWMPKKYRSILMEKNSQISTDFFIELYPIAHKLSAFKDFRYPEGIEKLIDSLIDIFEEGKVISDVKEFRIIRKVMGFYEKNNDIDNFIKLIKVFLENPEKNGLEIFEKELNSDRFRENVLKYMSYLNENLKDINLDYMSDFQFIDQLNGLRKTIEEVLERID